MTGVAVKTKETLRHSHDRNPPSEASASRLFSNLSVPLGDTDTYPLEGSDIGHYPSFRRKSGFHRGDDHGVIELFSKVLVLTCNLLARATE
jgi:hypothetical protein